jgi:hypothetical protein
LLIQKKTPPKPDAIVSPVTKDQQIDQALVTRVMNALRAEGFTGATSDNADQAPGSTNGDINRALSPNVLNSHDEINDSIVELVREMQADIKRSITTATGLIGYSLEEPAQVIVPAYTPLRNEIPRVAGSKTDLDNWKAITDFGQFGLTGLPGVVDEGGVPSDITYNVANFKNTYQTIGLKNSVTFQAQWRGGSLEGDVRARRVSELLYALMLVEEQWLINASANLWSPPPPLVAGASTGGTVAAGTYWVMVTSTNANGESPVSIVSLPVTTTGATSVLTLTIFTVAYASNYNVYVGQGAAAPALASMFKQVAGNFAGAALPAQPANQIQGNFNVTLTSLTTAGANASTVPVSSTAITAKSPTKGTPLSWDGLQSLVYQNYAAIVGGASTLGTRPQNSFVIQPAAATGFLALSDVQQLFVNMFNVARANPDTLYISAQDNLSLSNLVAQSNLTRIVIQADNPAAQGNLVSGYRVEYILNQATGKLVNVQILPFLPQGTMVVASKSMPYPVSGYEGPVMRVKTNQDYYSVDYPPTATQGTAWAFADMVDETFQIHYFGGFGIINGIIYH